MMTGTRSKMIKVRTKTLFTGDEVKPYFEDSHSVLYNGDSRVVLAGACYNCGVEIMRQPAESGQILAAMQPPFLG